MTQKKLTLNDLQTAIYNQNNVIVSLQSQVVTLTRMLADMQGFDGYTVNEPSVDIADAPKPKLPKFRSKLASASTTAPKSTSPKLKAKTPSTVPSTSGKMDAYKTLLTDALADIKQGIKAARFNEKIIPQCDYDLRVFCTRGMNKRIKAYRSENEGMTLRQVASDIVTLYGADKAAMLWE